MIFIAASEMKKFLSLFLKSMKKAKVSAGHTQSWFPHLVASIGNLQTQLLSPVILFNPPPIYFDY